MKKISFIILFVVCFLTGCAEAEPEVKPVNEAEVLAEEDPIIQTVSGNEIPKELDTTKSNIELVKDGYIRITPIDEEPMYFKLNTEDATWDNLEDPDNYIKALAFLNDSYVMFERHNSVQAKGVFYGMSQNYDMSMYADLGHFYLEDKSTASYEIIEDDIFTYREDAKDRGSTYVLLQGIAQDILLDKVNSIGLYYTDSSKVISFNKTDKDNLYFLSYTLEDEDDLALYAEQLGMVDEYVQMTAEVFFDDDLNIHSYRIVVEDPLQEQNLKEIFYTYDLEKPNWDVTRLYDIADFKNKRDVVLHIKDEYLFNVTKEAYPEELITLSDYIYDIEVSVPGYAELYVMYPSGYFGTSAKVVLYDSPKRDYEFVDLTGTGNLELWVSILSDDNTGVDEDESDN